MLSGMIILLHFQKWPFCYDFKIGHFHYFKDGHFLVDSFKMFFEIELRRFSILFAENTIVIRDKLFELSHKQGLIFVYYFYWRTELQTFSISLQRLGIFSIEPCKKAQSQ